MFIILMISLRVMPHLMTALRRLLRSVLILSFRLYYLVFEWLDRYLQPVLGASLLSRRLRIWACLVFSLLIGVMVALLFSMHTIVWCILIALVHGLIVALAWDEILRPDGFTLGVETE
jgi:hypothetical protein